MGFRINTNIAAMNSHRNATQTNMGLDKSLASLSSGLRINTAADDASGMTIADSLRSQAQGLGQAINNANDGVAVVQTADGALDEYINIINTVRTKAIQAASDGQNTDSRAAIQRDIDRLLEAADGIANQTQFNGQKLLDGTFTNKAFHIGAYAGETVSLSVDSVRTDAVGGIASITTKDNGQAVTSTLISSVASANVSAGANGVSLDTGWMTVNGTDITSSLNTLSPTNVQSAASVAAAIMDATDLLASANTTLEADIAAGGGEISDTANQLKINGYSIGDVTVLVGDSDGALVSAINDISHLSGVTATSTGGKLTLEAEDGRNINITTLDVAAGTAGGGAGTADATTGFTTDRSTTDVSVAVVANYGTAVAAVTLAKGDLIINGQDMVGTYGDGTTVGGAGDQLLAAIRAIDGMEDSYKTDTGADSKFTFVVNNGDDLNIAGAQGGVAGDFLGTTLTDTGIHNGSKVGEVEVYSEDKVIIGGTNATYSGFNVGGFTPSDNGTSLESIDVTSRNSAEVAILISDSALKQLDATRSDLGSVQNQLESTIRNISVTQVNVSAAESQIRDVDFAAESANFAKLNILAQSGSYAMSQANAVQQNVMRLLQ